MLGINVGVPAPMGFFPFGGWKIRFTVISMRRVLTPLLSTRERK